MRANLLTIFAGILSAWAAYPSAAHAAPQILGLVATSAPLPLHCVGGVCAVEVSGACLQEHRPAPVPGTAYRPAKGAALTLVAEDRRGKTRTMGVAELVEIRSLRAFNSLVVSLPERVVQKLADDVVLASLSVGPMTSLLPVAVAGDTDPLTDQEISQYTGPLRALAENAFGHGKANLTATRILNQMVNRLPADTSVGAESIATVRDQTMSQKITADMPMAARLVDLALDTCREKLRVDRTPHLRACIANQHDILNANTTLNVWRHLRPGS